ncbi:hypothetical protein C3489_18420 [Streptomyces sp. Ru71]|uniref:HGxxPAAW family protein n=1 Tax=Streptomyces sp. Ru71 TaxID=2080746 RepID=UPI000CDD4F08|nr:HGxxPAAW family protein [Streptomyces sp. Ru71]POX52165.1 hypothetical protein C3489_18420 [Streptomyces sp. Ru71]
MAGSSHGHTPAAWTGVIIAFIGFCIAGAFVVMAQPAGMWAGLGVAALGGVAGGVMRSMGMGAPKSASEPLVMADRPTANREAAVAKG